MDSHLNIIHMWVRWERNLSKFRKLLKPNGYIQKKNALKKC